MPHVDLVKTVVTALERLRRREIQGVRFTGLAGAVPERQTLMRALIEDQRPGLDHDVVVRALPQNDGFELTRASVQGDVIEIDVGTPRQ